MNDTLRRILVKLFFGEKLKGQLITLASATLAGYLLAYIPGAPHFVVFLVTVVFEIPNIDALTHAQVTGFFATILTVVINTIVHELVARDNNAALILLKSEGAYTGPLDSWVGPEAQASIAQLAETGEAWPANK
jgi:hypothetical protein